MSALSLSDRSHAAGTVACLLNLTHCFICRCSCVEMLRLLIVSLALCGTLCAAAQTVSWAEIS